MVKSLGQACSALDQYSPGYFFAKALTAILAGAGLAISGLLMQTLFRNPLAGPSVLGINAGASAWESLWWCFLPPLEGVGTRFLDGVGFVGRWAW